MPNAFVVFSLQVNCLQGHQVKSVPSAKNAEEAEHILYTSRSS